MRYQMQESGFSADLHILLIGEMLFQDHQSTWQNTYASALPVMMSFAELQRTKPVTVIPALPLQKISDCLKHLYELVKQAII